jgi:hypothetical protein
MNHIKKMKRDLDALANKIRSGHVLRATRPWGGLGRVTPFMLLVEVGSD